MDSKDLDPHDSEISLADCPTGVEDLDLSYHELFSSRSFVA